MFNSRGQHPPPCTNTEKNPTTRPAATVGRGKVREVDGLGSEAVLGARKSRELTFKMEVKDVEREKRETEEEEEGGGRRWMQQASRRCCCGLRVTGDGGKVSETRQKVAKQQRKPGRAERPRGPRRAAVALVHFVNERASVSC